MSNTCAFPHAHEHARTRKQARAQAQAHAQAQAGTFHRVRAAIKREFILVNIQRYMALQLLSFLRVRSVCCCVLSAKCRIPLFQVGLALLPATYRPQSRPDRWHEVWIPAAEAEAEPPQLRCLHQVPHCRPRTHLSKLSFAADEPICQNGLLSKSFCE